MPVSSLRLAIPLLVVLTALATASPAHAGDPAPLGGIGATETWPGVTFEKPMVLVPEPGGSGAWVVLEQGGKVKRIASWSGQGAV